MMMAALSYPHPYCVLRAVPTATTPAAPPGQASPFQGPHMGWGWIHTNTLGNGYDPNPADTPRDYYVERSQSRAENDYDSVASCGLCDTYLFDPVTLGKSNPIWWSNAALFGSISNGPTNRTSVKVDGANAYTAASAYSVGGGILRNKPGFPKLSMTQSVDPATGDLKIHEHSEFASCSGDPTIHPPTNQTCPSFAKPVVQLDRTITQRDSGLQAAIVDRWSSVDGQAHQLDAYYDDEIDDTNYAQAGHESKWNFTWTGDGFTTYPPDTSIPVPAAAPGTVEVKTDGFVADAGDKVNPMGALTYGTLPSEIIFRRPVSAQRQVGDWQARYQKTIPAKGDLTIIQIYSHEFDLASVQDKVQVAELATHAPSVAITSPVAGVTVDAESVQVTGTASSPDGQPSVTVNGVDATVAGDGSWSAQVPITPGANSIVAVATNAIGVPARDERSVNRPLPPAEQPAPATEQAPTAASSLTTPPAVTPPAAVRCVVPKLRGKTLAQAKRLLAKAHCKLGKVSRKPSSRVRVGRVLATRPKPGAKRAAGARIPVTLATAARR
jgi:hypothetical protein